MEASQESLRRALTKSLTLAEVIGHPMFCCYYRNQDAFAEVLSLANSIVDPGARKQALRQMSIWHGIKLKELQQVGRSRK